MCDSHHNLCSCCSLNNNWRGSIRTSLLLLGYDEARRKTNIVISISVVDTIKSGADPGIFKIQLALFGKIWASYRLEPVCVQSDIGLRRKSTLRPSPSEIFEKLWPPSRLSYVWGSKLWGQKITPPLNSPVVAHIIRKLAEKCIKIWKL